ncbi:hypothetical protein ACFLS5_03640 [Candidatus Bipolaricaulota bacterium]
MRLLTAAQVIDLATRLEEESSGFYACLAKACSDHGDLFQSYSRQNSKHAKQIEEAYRYAVSDALETGFSFDLEEDDYALDSDMAESARFAARIAQAKDIEEVSVRFFREAARQSESLMADIHGLFRALAKKRARRLSELAGLEQEAAAR